MAGCASIVIRVKHPAVAVRPLHANREPPAVHLHVQAVPAVQRLSRQGPSAAGTPSRPRKTGSCSPGPFGQRESFHAATACRAVRVKSTFRYLPPFPLRTRTTALRSRIFKSVQRMLIQMWRRTPSALGREHVEVNRD